MTSVMPQDKYPLLDILTSSVFEIVCCSIKQLRNCRTVAGGKKERKKEKGRKTRKERKRTADIKLRN